MATALYRKYRPTSLEDVVGQSQVIKPLENAIKSGKFSHAYLFTGPRGCGKTSVARIFAHEVNGFPYEIEDSYVDIIEIDAASNTGVDNIRELREKANVAPTTGKYKVYIIDEVHMLSKAAFNALLKTLEEPPAHVIFIMATTDAYKVPITISSRSQVFRFDLATPDVMLKHLEKIAKQEKIDIEKDALGVIVERGGGSFRDSISLLDQISTLKRDKINKEDIIQALGLPEDTMILELLEAYKQGNTAKISENLHALLSNNTKPELIAEELIRKIISTPDPGALNLLKKLPEVSAPFPEAKLLLAFLEDSATAPKFTPLSTPVPTPVVAKVAHSKTPKTAENPPEAKKELESPQAPATSVPTPISTVPSNFSKETFIENVGTSSSLLKSTLEKCEFVINSREINLIPSKKFEKTILSGKNNQALLKKFLPPDFLLNILDPGEKIKNDPALTQISDIMGGNIEEVKSDGVPF